MTLVCESRRRQSWGVIGGRNPQILRWGSQGSWTGRKILLYLIMYRKIVPNRVICPEIAANSQFLPGKSHFLLSCLKSRNISNIFLENLKFFVKLSEKNRNFSVTCPSSLKILGPSLVLKIEFLV